MSGYPLLREPEVTYPQLDIEILMDPIWGEHERSISIRGWSIESVEGFFVYENEFRSSFKYIVM